MSVSRRAGPPHCGQRRVHPVLGRRQRGAALRPVVLDVGQQDRQVLLRHRHQAAAIAVDHRDRRAPVALAGEQPVAQAVVDRPVPAPLLVEPVDDRVLGLDRRHAGEVARVDEHLALGVLGVGLPVGDGAVGGRDDLADREVERLREVVVALVVGGHGHDRAGAVLHQHVVGDEHRDPLTVDGVDDRAAERDAGLGALGVGALLAALAERVVDVVADGLLVLGAGRQAHDVRVLGGHHEERRAEQRVGPGGEDRVLDAQLRLGERHLGALRATDPVALHRDDVRRPLDRLEVVEQAVGVVGDAEEPLLELPDLDRGAAALAMPVDHLLVGEHGGVLRAPVDGRLLAVGQSALVELQEEPLGPAVVARLVGAELARPVDRDPPRPHPALERLDRLPRRVTRVLAGVDGVVLGRQAERVVAHRMQHAPAGAAVEVRDRVADGVVLQMPDVRLARGVRQHLEHVRGGNVAVLVVRDLPGPLTLPDLLPLGFDLSRVVTVLGRHGARRLAPLRFRPRAN